MSVVRRLWNVARGKARVWREGDPHDPSLADEPLRRPPPSSEPAAPPPDVPEPPEPPAEPRKRRL